MMHGYDTLHTLAAEPRLACPLERFYFCRHGETEGNFKRIVQHPEIALSERGRAQAQAAAELLRDGGFDRIVASDYRRADETARAIAELSGKPMTHETGLRERNFGALRGTSSIGVDWACEPEGGETLPQFITRVREGVAAIAEEGGVPLMVAHGGVLRVVVAALGATMTDHAIGNATPLLFERDGLNWRYHRIDGAKAA